MFQRQVSSALLRSQYQLIASIAAKAGRSGSSTSSIDFSLVAPKESVQRRLLKHVLPHVIIVLIVVGYVFAGATLFLYLEQPTQIQQRNKGLAEFKLQFDALENTLISLVNQTVSTDIIEPTSVTKLRLRRELRKFLRNWDQISKKFDLQAIDDWEDEPNLRATWTFPEAILFSFTLITTIGYGTVTPTTDAGRIVCIFYGLFGIPLTMIAIANTGKFFGEALAYVIYWLRTGCRYTWRCLCCCYCLRRRTMPLADQKKAAAGAGKGKPGDAGGDSAEAEDGSLAPSTKLISVQWLLVVFFAYVMIGAVVLPQYEEMNFTTACYFCFISITTVGFGDVYPRKYDYLLPTIIYLALGLALTTMAIEVSADYLLKIHYLGTTIQNAKTALIRFGNKILTVGDLVSALGKQYGISENEIEQVKEKLDIVVKETIVEKEVKKEEEKKRVREEIKEKFVARVRHIPVLKKTSVLPAAALPHQNDIRPNANGIPRIVLNRGSVFQVNENLRYIDDDDAATPNQTKILALV